MNISEATVSLIVRLSYTFFGVLNLYLINKMYGVEFYGYYAWIISATYFANLLALAGINSFLIKYFGENNELPNSFKDLSIHFLFSIAVLSLIMVLFW